MHVAVVLWHVPDATANLRRVGADWKSKHVSAAGRTLTSPSSTLMRVLLRRHWGRATGDSVGDPQIDSIQRSKSLVVLREFIEFNQGVHDSL